MRIICLVTVLSVACSGESAETDAAGDPVTQRQRDSAVSASGLPGAGGVRGAIGASDAAAARRALEDSLAR